MTLVVVTLSSGCFGLGKQGNAVDPTTLTQNLTASFAASAPLMDQSNMIRSSGPATFVRIAQLFPTYSNYSAEFGPAPTNPLDAPLGSRDRPISPLAQYSLRTWAVGGCNGITLSSNLFLADRSILMEGETLPTDPTTRLAFAAARNGWLYPYTADSSEVQALSALYTALTTGTNGKPDSTLFADGLKSVCLSVITAPQFWIGNQDPADSLRRAVLELGRRVPTFQEYSDYIGKKRTLSDIISQIQTTDGYSAAIRDWHKSWLSFFPPKSFSAFDVRPVMPYQGSYFGAINNYIMKLQPGEPIQGAWIYPISQNSGYAPTVMSSTQPCDHIDQPFDPRTTEIRWEQLNPINSAWETIGSWKRDRDPSGNWLTTWSKVGGHITLASGAQLNTSLSDVTSSASINPALGYAPYHYKKGALVGTPLDNFDATKRRVRRFAVSGEQNGMSQVQQYFTHEPVYVCNNLDRMLATCAYRPNKRSASDIARTFYDYSSWDATDPLIINDVRLLTDTWMHPVVMDGMKCGVPNMSAMAQLGTAAQYPNPWDDPKETIAWPWGYSSLSQDVSSLSLNTLAYGLSIDSWYYPFLNGPYAWQEYDASVEIAANISAKKDMAEEPYRLIDEIVRNNRPYSDLVTANYTFGTPAYETLLRTQGYFLPGYPGAYVPNTDPSQASQVNKIDYSTFADIPLNAIQSVTGSHSINDKVYFSDIIPMGTIHPKAHSGILNMPAFLSQYAPYQNSAVLGLRTMSARYFERLLCKSPGDVTAELSPSQLAMQTPFIPQTEGAAKDHLDPTKGCYQCHVNLDPLASALSSNFSTNIASYAMGDLRMMDAGPYYQGETYGIRGGGKPGEGAFLGTHITGGLVQVGKVLAASTDFYQCVVKRAFENLYGRDPAISDAKAYMQIVSDFQKNQRYNQMILDLVDAPTFQKGN